MYASQRGLTRPISRQPSPMLGLLAGLAAGLTPHCAVWAQETGAHPPNVVLMIIDDLGWTDAGAYGSTFYETPSIDRLAGSGARFTSFYTASPVCSPTRASLMTGRNPARVGITNWIGGEQAGLLLQTEYRRELALEEVTIGEAFVELGYATGYIGKWHLGEAGFMPGSQGFDDVRAVNRGGQPSTYFQPYSNPRSPQWDVPDLDEGPEGEYLTDRLTDEAVRFIEANAHRPFFLVLSHYAVHTPLQSRPDQADRFGRKAASLPDTVSAFRDEGEDAITKLRQDHAVYAGMIASTDESVGRIVDTLARLGIEDNTIVVFVSDNGGLTTLVRDNRGMPTAVLPLRAGKGWLYEGGIRAPLIVRWPGTIPAGLRVDEAVTSSDLFPTLLELAGAELRPADHVDGRSVVPLLRGEPALPERPLFWHFPHYHGSGNRPSGAVRLGSYKLIEWFEDGRTELYDLVSDVGETHDLSGEQPAKARELIDLLRGWREEIGARMPQPNPAYRGPARGGGDQSADPPGITPHARP